MTYQCRVCHGLLQSILDFGSLRLSCFPREATEVDRSPLDFCRCRSCGLVQLAHTADRDAMFRHYWYRSGVNEVMREELADVVRDGIRYVGGLKDDTVLDIGANDGTLLAEYAKQAPLANPKRIAYEPAENLAGELLRNCDILRTDYFPNMWRFGKAKLITSIACFYAVNDPRRFVEAIDELLTPDGAWIVQFQDLCQILEATAFDDICHEHLFYPSLASVERLLEPFDLMVFDAKRREVNGGSLRLAIGRRHRVANPRVASLRTAEFGCESAITLTNFARQVEFVRSQIRETLLRNRDAGLTIDLYGASTKGNMLLQVCDLGPDVIRQAWERSEAKWGCQTVTGIPIVSEQAGRDNPPDMLFVGIWQFRDAILKREAGFKGQFLFPLPAVELVSQAVA